MLASGSNVSNRNSCNPLIAAVMKDEQGRPFIVVREYVKGNA